MRSSATVLSASAGVLSAVLIFEQCNNITVKRRAGRAGCNEAATPVLLISLQPSAQPKLLIFCTAKQPVPVLLISLFLPLPSPLGSPLAAGTLAHFYTCTLLAHSNICTLLAHMHICALACLKTQRNTVCIFQAKVPLEGAPRTKHCVFACNAQ